MGQILMRTDCKICEGEVALEEAARPILATECEGFEREHVGLLTVANAKCRVCDALYLAWVKHANATTGRPIDRSRPFVPSWLANNNGDPFVDLSFRHSFSDLPSSRDLPSVARLREIHHAEMRAQAAEYRADAADMVRSAETLERDAAADAPSFWELFYDEDRASILRKIGQ